MSNYNYEWERPDYSYGYIGEDENKAQDPELCVVALWRVGTHQRQCSRKRGHGHRRLYCKQHGKRYQGGIPLKIEDK